VDPRFSQKVVAKECWTKIRFSRFESSLGKV
jgi:hypothetical protein